MKKIGIMENLSSLGSNPIFSTARSPGISTCYRPVTGSAWPMPDILLLDEVTSALDPDTARQIEEMILRLPGTTVIHISYKPAPALMAQYDAVITMDAGRITEVRTA